MVTSGSPSSSIISAIVAAQATADGAPVAMQA
jgi:hypothetical protein